MPDNYLTNPGVGGLTFASDEIAAVHYPRAKVGWGVDGSYVDASASNPLPIAAIGNVATTAAASSQVDGHSVTVGAQADAAAASDTATASLIGLTKRLLQRITSLIGLFPTALTGSGNFKVALVESTATQAVSGTVSATQSGTWNVATVSALTAITNALPAGTNNIGDVDVLTLPAGSMAAATAKTSDFDTGVGTDTVAMLGIALPGSGGAVVGGTQTNPLRFDPTGTTTQPISGTVSVSGSVTVDSELPAAAALADAAGNPTTPSIGGCVLVFNGTNWDRARGDLANGLDVDVTRLPALPTGANTIGSVTQASGPWTVSERPATSGGLSMSKTISAASTNATSVKASAGQVYAIQVFNLNAAARYLKLYNKASAPTVGSDTPVKTILIPGNTAGAGVVARWPSGLEFTTGIAFAITTGIGDADTGAVAANEIAVNLDYK